MTLLAVLKFMGAMLGVIFLAFFVFFLVLSGAAKEMWDEVKQKLKWKIK